LPWDVFAGAVAGAAGSWLMSPVQKAITKKLPEQAKAREEAVSPKENAPTKVGRVAAETVGVEVPEEQRPKLGQVVHFAYGTAWGAAYGLLRHRFPRLPRASGLLFGAALWLLGDELMLPALELAPPAPKFPKETHLRALAAHLAYGASVDQGIRLIERARA
jgi:uncharacterized membrane protein YagU involved in acid resistance